MTHADHRTLASTFRQEQHSLHEKIDEWRMWWKELSELGQPRFGEMNDRMRLIRDRLKAHFRHEEESGIFQEVAELNPEQAQRAARMLSDHQKLLNDLNHLCMKLGAAEPEFENWGDAKLTFEEFLNALDAHEREETRLMNLWGKSDSQSN